MLGSAFPWKRLLPVLALCASAALAQQSHSTPDNLPDPLRFSDGRKVTRMLWPKRREELLRLFSREMYGQMPPLPKLTFREIERDAHAFGGKATRKQLKILLAGTPDGPAMDLLLYLPNGVKRPPVFLGLNFWGNHAISVDPAIRLSRSWMESGKLPWADLSCVRDHRATEACRGINASQWPLEMILARGYAVATVYFGDIDPGSPQTSGSVRSLFPQLNNRGDNFSVIAAWAWGLSRAMDYLQTDSELDAGRVAVFGWSRLGKAALWAAATDSRFAALISNESGAGGAKLFRHGQGENIRRLNTKFPDWFCNNFKNYNDRDVELPFDQHMVLALVAPRPVYVASAAGDAVSDPKGEFLAAQAAGGVYRLLGVDGLPSGSWPALNQPVGGRLRYHVRSGRHDVTEFDWQQFLDFADRYLKWSVPR